VYYNTQYTILQDNSSPASGSAPILDIQGANDPYRPRSRSNELVAEFGARRVSVVVIPHAAHAVIVEQPRFVADAIIKFAGALSKYSTK